MPAPRCRRTGIVLSGAVVLGLLAGVVAGSDPGATSGRPGVTSKNRTVAMVPRPGPDAQPSAQPSPREAPPTAVRVRVLGLELDRHGRWLARLQAGDAPPQQAQVGDVIARGLRLERVEPGRVTLRRGLQLETLAAPQPAVPPARTAEPLPAILPAVIVSPPGQEPPRSSAVDRAIQRAVPPGADRSSWQSAHTTGH